MPVLGDEDVLVRVRAASVNPLDWHFMRGTPYLIRMLAGLSRPRLGRLGADMAGTVEEVGKNVTAFKVGDEVFGGLEDRGTLAEYVSTGQDAIVVRKPGCLTFEQAAAVPVAGFTALQALRDHGRLEAGQKVLVNGASGGVGTFAVQIAKALGAEVTGVCSSRNVAMAASIGADHVIDYTRQDFTRAERRYDLLIDIAGNRALAEIRRVLTPGGALVVVGGPNKGRWIGPMARSLRMAVVSPAVSQRLVSFLARQSKADLAVLEELLQKKKITPVIDRTYPLTEVAEAISYLEQGHARGKVVITA
jgi:NADPH:quinone reductase-like Zn-dependent oxidoreductase